MLFFPTDIFFVSVFGFESSDAITRLIQNAIIRSYTCIQCGHTYKYKRSLSRHLRFECGKEPEFKCPFCPSKTKLKENLKRHIKYKHRF